MYRQFGKLSDNLNNTIQYNTEKEIEIMESTRMKEMDELYDYTISCGSSVADAYMAVVDAYCLDYVSSFDYAYHIADGEAFELLIEVLDNYFDVN